MDDEETGFNDDSDDFMVKDADDWEESESPYGIKIEPDKYIDRGILLAQQALLTENTREGMLKYCLIVDNISKIALASKKITKEQILEIKDSDRKDELLKRVDRANEYLELIIESVISSKPIKKKLDLKIV